MTLEESFQTEQNTEFIPITIAEAVKFMRLNKSELYDLMINYGENPMTRFLEKENTQFYKIVIYKEPVGLI